MFAKGVSSVMLEARQKISDADIIGFYLGITKIPTRISSPLRRDNNPSFGLFSFNGIDIFYKDFATNESGSVIQLFQKIWGLSYEDTWERIVNDITYKSSVNIAKCNISTPKVDTLDKAKTKLEVVVREWEDYDIAYWKQYGISLDWLKFAEVYPISYIIFNKNNSAIPIVADKHSYVYVEFKEGKTTYKVYQPYNKKGCKWFNNHDGSVISLWTKVPTNGDTICICSSVKDALCLWANTGIPAIAPQGEGYGLSEHAINDLKSRYKNIYILFDNDKPGIEDSQKLSKLTGFTSVTLPPFKEGKDVSDFYKSLYNKDKFKLTILKLLNYEFR